MKEIIKFKIKENNVLFQVEVFDEIEYYKISLNDLFNHSWEKDKNVPAPIRNYLKTSKNTDYNFALETKEFTKY